MIDVHTLTIPPAFTVASYQEVQAPSDIPVRVHHPDSGFRVELQPAVELAPGWYRLELRFPSQGVVQAVLVVHSNQNGQCWLRLSALDRNYFGADIRLTGKLRQLSLILTGSGDIRRPNVFSFERLSRFNRVVSLTRRAFYVLNRDRFGFIRSALRAAAGSARSRAINQSPAPLKGERPYDRWI